MICSPGWSSPHCQPGLERTELCQMDRRLCRSLSTVSTSRSSTQLQEIWYFSPNWVSFISCLISSCLEREVCRRREYENFIPSSFSVIWVLATTTIPQSGKLSRKHPLLCRVRRVAMIFNEIENVNISTYKWCQGLLLG